MAKLDTELKYENRKGFPPLIKTKISNKEPLIQKWSNRIEIEILINLAILNPDVE